MGFSFRLESVLRYRQRVVDRQGREVALAQAAVAEWQVRLQNLEAEITRSIESGCMNFQGGLRVQDMVAKATWLEYLRHRKSELMAGLRRAQVELMAQRENLQAAWRDLEVLDQLKAKQKEAWIRELETRERKELDEIGQIRADQARRSNLASAEEYLS